MSTVSHSVGDAGLTCASLRAENYPRHLVQHPRTAMISMLHSMLYSCNTELHHSKCCYIPRGTCSVDLLYAMVAVLLTH